MQGSNLESKLKACAGVSSRKNGGFVGRKTHDNAREHPSTILELT